MNGSTYRFTYYEDLVDRDNPPKQVRIFAASEKEAERKFRSVIHYEEVMGIEKIN
jgi:hypothetical protein